MLESLDTVPWSTLSHAYGPAEDVPLLLRSLTGSDDEVRGKALHSLYGNIFHQGTRYQATPYAVPFLYELVSNPEIRGRDEIVMLLVHVALAWIIRE